MIQEVSDLVGELFDRHRTVANVRIAFATKQIDDDLIAIAAKALELIPQSPTPPGLHLFVWLGYEIAIDSKYLPEVYK